MVVQITVSGSFKHRNGCEIRSRTIYCIVAIDDAMAPYTSQWHAYKAYSDIAALDSHLASTYPSMQRLQLPEKGTFGFRHYLDIGGFNTKRFQGIQQYFAHLAPQLDSVTNSNIMSKFFAFEQEYVPPVSALPAQPDDATMSVEGLVSVGRPCNDCIRKAGENLSEPAAWTNPKVSPEILADRVESEPERMHLVQPARGRKTSSIPKHQAFEQSPKKSNSLLSCFPGPEFFPRKNGKYRSKTM